MDPLANVYTAVGSSGKILLGHLSRVVGDFKAHPQFLWNLYVRYTGFLGHVRLFRKLEHLVSKRF